MWANKRVIKNPATQASSTSRSILSRLIKTEEHDGSLVECKLHAGLSMTNALCEARDKTEVQRETTLICGPSRSEP